MTHGSASGRPRTIDPIAAVLAVLVVGVSCVRDRGLAPTGTSGTREPILEAPAVGGVTTGFRMDSTPYLVVRLCAAYVNGDCEAGALVDGPVPDGPDELVVEGTWYVIVEVEFLDDPILVA